MRTVNFPRRRFLYLAAGAAALSVVSRVANTQNGPSPEKTRTRLITLGTGAGPVPAPQQAKSSNLLTVNGTHYLVDAGDGVARRLAKARIDIRDVATIFVTHHHDDHTAGLGPLMSAAWDQNRTKSINVYGPPPTEEFVKAIVQLFDVSAKIRIADGGVSVPLAQVFFGHDVDTGQIYRDSNITVTAVENSHYQLHSGSDIAKHKSYAYRFEAPDRVIVFTGDTGPSDAVTELANGADLLVTPTSSFKERMELMIKTGRWQTMTLAEQERFLAQAKRNITLEDIGKMGAHANVKTIVLSHSNVGTENGAQWVAEVKQHFSGQVQVAKDLMKF
jgi:ribonuclease BN (tRNA processing enzyme)